MLGLDCRKTGDQESPVAGEKPDDSGCKHPSLSVFSPADVPWHVGSASLLYLWGERRAFPSY
jgi:hypothetical protein